MVLHARCMPKITHHVRWKPSGWTQPNPDRTPKPEPIDHLDRIATKSPPAGQSEIPDPARTGRAEAAQIGCDNPADSSCEQRGWFPPPTGQHKRVRCDVGPFSWVTSHVFRKTVATRLDDACLSARQIADQLGHARPSLTQDVYMGRKA